MFLHAGFPVGLDEIGGGESDEQSQTPKTRPAELPWHLDSAQCAIAGESRDSPPEDERQRKIDEHHNFCRVRLVVQPDLGWRETPIHASALADEEEDLEGLDQGLLG